MGCCNIPPEDHNAAHSAHSAELGQVWQCPLPPRCHPQTCSSTSSSPLTGDIGVVTWPSGKEQMGTRYIQWFSI